MSDRRVKRVVMAKRVAERWVESHSETQYRMAIHLPSDSNLNFPLILRAFRNSKVRLASVPPISDLGMDVGFDNIVVWSKNRMALLALESWLQARGCETIGVE